MIEKKETIAVWKWYKNHYGFKCRIYCQNPRMPMKYTITEYYDGRIMTTGSLAKCKKWIEERRCK